VQFCKTPPVQDKCHVAGVFIRNDIVHRPGRLTNLRVVVHLWPAVPAQANTDALTTMSRSASSFTVRKREETSFKKKIVSVLRVVIYL